MVRLLCIYSCEKVKYLTDNIPDFCSLLSVFSPKPLNVP